MADGLSFVFQIDSDTPGLDDLLAKLDKANSSVVKGDQGLRGLDRGMRKAAEGARETEGAFGKLVTNGLDPFIKRAERIAEFEFVREGVEELIKLPGEIAEKIFDLGEEALLTAAKTERMGRAFENALGPDVGKETFEYFDAVADKTEYTRGQLRSFGLELAKSGFQGEGLKNATAAIADLGSMTENPAEGAALATSALQRVMATGRLEARALMPFGIQKGEFQKELSAETGLGIKAMQKEMEAGKIPTGVVLNSLFKTITNKTGKDLGTLGTEMTDTLDARLAHLKERPEQIFESLVGTDGYRQVSDFFGRMSDALDPSTPIGQILSGALQTAFGELGTTLQGVDLGAVFGEVAEFIKGLPDDLREAGKWVRDDLVPAAKEAWEIFKDIVDFLHTTITGLAIAKDAISHVLGGGTSVGESQDRSQRAVDLLGKQGSLPSQGALGGFLANHIPGYGFVEDRILNPQFWMKRFGAETKDAGSNDAKGYASGLKDSTPVALDAMTSFGQDTVDALKDAHQQKSPSRLFHDVATMDAEGYAGGWRDAIADGTVSMDALAEQQPAAAGGGGGAVTIETLIGNLSITVEGGSDAYESGRLAVRGAQDEIELVVLQLFERIAKKRGSA